MVVRMVWGTYLEKNCPCWTGHLLLFFLGGGGSKQLPGWFGALLQWKMKFKWAFLVGLPLLYAQGQHSLECNSPNHASYKWLPLRTFSLKGKTTLYWSKFYPFQCTASAVKDDSCHNSNTRDNSRKTCACHLQTKLTVLHERILGPRWFLKPFLSGWAHPRFCKPFLADFQSSLLNC